MAEEAAVENLPYFCHKCNREITVVLPNFTCPNCQSGFIEALVTSSESNDDSDVDIEPHPLDEAINVFHEMLFATPTAEERRNYRRGRRQARTGRLVRTMRDVPIEALLQDFVLSNAVYNLTETGWGPVGSNTIGVGTGGRGGGPVLLLGNPGDYAWGREGLDAIVTQLLNQMDTTGPPPLTKDKINEIPFSVITKEQVDMNLQCSVCWEDFEIDELVRKLPCEHVYHDCCIIPWLQLHGTCPICRKTLIEEARTEDADSTNSTAAYVGNSLANLFRFAENSNSRTSTSSSSSNSSTGNNSTSSSSTRSDFNMDVEFD